MLTVVKGTQESNETFNISFRLKGSLPGRCEEDDQSLEKALLELEEEHQR